MLGRGSDSDGGSGRGPATPGEELDGRGVDVRWRRLLSRSAHQMSRSTASRSADWARSAGSEVSCEMRARVSELLASGDDLVLGVGQPLRRVESPGERSEAGEPLFVLTAGVGQLGPGVPVGLLRGCCGRP